MPMGTHDYKGVLTQALQASADAFNNEYKAGWPLTNINPQFGMLGGLLKNMTVSPYITDHWLFAGFEMQADLPTMVEPTLDFII